jgi:glutamine synthetase
VLDKKTPLLRSTVAIDKAARKVLDILGMPTEKVVTTVGPEQEYFLVDKAMWEKRKDLVYTGRTFLAPRS